MPNKWKPKSELANVVHAAGFKYDPTQDIIYSRMNAWQRYFGYAYAYDLAAPATISAIIDCEPIFFRYKKRDWMIELWKGQYGLETGGEVGVYICKKPLLNQVLGKRPHDPENGKFFDCVGNRRKLKMSFNLKHNGETLFKRGPEKHWWLTGFKWGVLSLPGELTMDLSITFPSNKMCTVFVKALEKAGYEDIDINEKSVSFTFDKPVTYQPRTDPETRNFVKTAKEINSKIVIEYNQLELKNNDPNQIPKELEEKLINYFNSQTKDSFKNNLTEFLKNSDYPLIELIKDLENISKDNLTKIGKILHTLKNFFTRILG